MQNVLKIALALAVVVAGRTDAQDTGMRFLAKQNPTMQVLIERLDPDLARNGRIKK